MRHSLQKKLWLFGPAIAWCATIYSLSAQSSLPAAPGGDKLAHFAAYFVMGVLFFRATYFGSTFGDRAVFLISASAAAIYGATDEFHQMFVPNRNASLGDLAADACGAFAGAAVLLAVYRTVARMNTRFSRGARRFTSWVVRDSAAPCNDSEG